MTRLLVHVEGQTEETFVNEILRPHLQNWGYTRISARLVGNARQRDRRGGIRPWTAVRGEIIRHLKGDRSCLATTMVDYYGLPQSVDKGWPGRAEAGKLPFSEKAACIEDAILLDICSEMGSGFARFIPFVIMHEFEALLFSNCDAFASGIGHRQLGPSLKAIRDQFASPEEINDSPLTCPSKRVVGLVPGYTKPLMGVLAIIEIGLPAIRAECPHFNEWLSLLEHWPSSKS